MPEGSPAARELGGNGAFGAGAKRAVHFRCAAGARCSRRCSIVTQGGQAFGTHVDNAIRQVTGTPHRIRTDLSATLFFTNPEEYDGGELVVEDTYRHAQRQASRRSPDSVSRDQPASRAAGDARGAPGFLFLDSKHGSRRRRAHAAVRSGHRHSTAQSGKHQPPLPCNSPASITTWCAAGRRSKHMTIRRVLFWLHLTAGCIGGAVILLMSVTGVLLTYEKEMTAWADRGFQVAAGGERLPVETLLDKIRELRHALPSNFTLRSDPAAPAMATFGRDSVVYANSYTGEILGEGSKNVRTFFQTITSWHRWLGVEGSGRPARSRYHSACNFAFLFLVLSGFYLWLPRKWSRSSARAVALYRGGLSGKARDFNWHNVTGIWCFAPLVLIVAAGVVMSYPWANALVYRAAGSAVPVQQGNGNGGGREGRPAQEIKLGGLNELWAQAERQVPGWQSISLRVPARIAHHLRSLSTQETAFEPDPRD